MELVEVGAEFTAAENTDRPVVISGVVARILECLPRGFQEQPVLGIGEGGVARRETEEGSVEHVDVAEQRGGVHVPGKAGDLIRYPG